MHEENAPASAITAAIAVGTGLAVLGLVWWFMLLVTSPTSQTSVASTQRSTEPAEASQPSAQPSTVVSSTSPGRRLVSLSEPVLFDTDLGTGSTEFSAVTLNEDTGRLVVADDEGKLFEFNLDQAGIPIVPARRSIDVEIGDSDIEGLAWIAGTTYVLAHEATGELSVVDIDDEQRVIDTRDRSRTIDTQVTEVDGAGIEGVTTVETIDDVEFIVVVERPPSMHFIDDDGDTTLQVPLRLGVEDIADVWAAPDASMWLVSDRGQVIVRIQVGTGGRVRQLQQIDLVFADGQFQQPEGLVVSRDGHRLYVVGESPGPGRFSLGVWQLD